MRFLIVVVFIAAQCFEVSFGYLEIEPMNHKITDLKKCCQSQIIKNERSPRTMKIITDCLEEEYVKKAGVNKQLCHTYCVNMRLGAYDPVYGFNFTLYSSKMKTFLETDEEWKKNIDSVKIIDTCFKNIVPYLDKCTIEFLKSKLCFWNELNKYCPAELKNNQFC